MTTLQEQLRTCPERSRTTLEAALMQKPTDSLSTPQFSETSTMSLVRGKYET